MSIDGEIGLRSSMYSSMHSFENSFRFQNELDRVAASAITARVRRDVVRLGLHLLPRIGHSHGKPALAHHRKVDHVVAHIGDFIQRDAFLLHDFAEACILNAWPR